MATTLTANGSLEFSDGNQQKVSAISGLHGFDWYKTYLVSDTYGQRTTGTTYTNSTDRPIGFAVSNYFAGSSCILKVYIDNVAVYNTSFTGTGGNMVIGIVPPGSTYKVDANTSIYQWAELGPINRSF